MSTKIIPEFCIKHKFCANNKEVIVVSVQFIGCILSNKLIFHDLLVYLSVNQRMMKMNGYDTYQVCMYLVSIYWYLAHKYVHKMYRNQEKQCSSRELASKV